jgi:hypothetical protein
MEKPSTEGPGCLAAEGGHVFQSQDLEAVPDFGMAITGGYLVIIARIRDMFFSYRTRKT